MVSPSYWGPFLCMFLYSLLLTRIKELDGYTISEKSLLLFMMYYYCFVTFCDFFAYYFQIAMCGFTEVQNYILCSYKEIFSMLNRKDDKSTAVIIANPRSSDFEVSFLIKTLK